LQKAIALENNLRALGPLHAAITELFSERARLMNDFATCILRRLSRLSTVHDIQSRPIISADETPDLLQLLKSIAEKGAFTNDMGTINTSFPNNILKVVPDVQASISPEEKIKILGGLVAVASSVRETGVFLFASPFLISNFLFLRFYFIFRSSSPRCC
jgi:hypothetical protein